MEYYIGVKKMTYIYELHKTQKTMNVVIMFI